MGVPVVLVHDGYEGSDRGGSFVLELQSPPLRRGVEG